MRSGQVYPVLARALDEWRVLPAHALASAVGAPAEVSELLLEGELVRIETSVTWVNAKHEAVHVEAVAYGPANWQTERVSEKILVSLKPQNGGGDV